MKNVLIFSLVVLLTGCGWRVESFKESNNEIMQIVKKGCDEAGGQYITGIEISYTLLADEVTYSHYCLLPNVVVR